MILTETPRRKLVTKLVNWGHWFALLNIVLAIVIASIYVFSSPVPGTVVGSLYLFTNWFSHMGFLTFMAFVIVILPLCYLVPNANVVKGLSSVVAASGLALLAFDALLFNKYGLHLNLSSAELIRSETKTVVAQLTWSRWLFLALLFMVWLSFQLIVANAIWKRIERLQKFKLGLPISSFFVLCFVSSHAMHVWADANLYQPVVKQDDMFPLSYPATAKTLMSRYGLLDIQNYRQRKALQVDYGSKQLQYPTEPVYCGINTASQSIVVIVDGELPNDEGFRQQLASFNKYSGHYTFGANYQSMVTTTLFGLPELYQPSLSNKTPLVLELVSKMGVNVTVYSDSVIEHDKVVSYTKEWSAFTRDLQKKKPTLAFAFVNSSQVMSLLSTVTNSGFDVLLTSYSQDPHGPVQLYSNYALNTTLSTSEDIAPTVLSRLGCAAAPSIYSTGRSLIAPNRNWVVSTTDNKVVVLYNGHKIDVLGNGNYKIYERDSGEESLAPLNTSLLSQAMKHLSRFYQ
ncbi:DUF3413 domain-containing protein [Aestuariibacter sp. AA17]|uniref:DUF3413 domain-containing protein n=1 Tax=Fluctibacter corallii TaxID=2984329 RepID=A0ABT3AAA2_9ALTE|nr:DUF3413 domain-containing protein [Aestuariibacter sp. AA17]MCV2885241.1 DUF3413 domain-containing protein [Aestuariibacter sp. AA17]